MRFSGMFLPLVFSSTLWVANGTSPSCSAVAIPYPNIVAARTISLSAVTVTNYSLPIPQTYYGFAQNLSEIAFCNVSVQYTHPGYNDNINVQIWLPLEQEDWNKRFMGTGGGAWATELSPATLAYPVSVGYAAVATDGGHASDVADPSAWALSSRGNVDWIALQNFASTSLDEAATIGKAVTTAFYGSPPKHSYWTGCSTGGRQGFQLAQRYPLQYDGILAAAPAIYFMSLNVALYWAQLVMNQLGVYPPQCEFEVITAAATKACDSLDGVSDGIVSNPNACNFDPTAIIGQNFDCPSTGKKVSVSSEAAQIALAAWTGPRTAEDGKFLWYGLNRDAPLAALVNTTGGCNGSCHEFPYPPGTAAITLFMEKNPDFDIYNMSPRRYESIFRQSVNQYDSIIGTSYPDLTDFRDVGGKMITWHGLSDEIIFPNGTYHYYRQVVENDPNAADYYRFFPVPGVHHCAGGIGPFPDRALQSLVDWVEKGTVPDILEGTSLPDANGTVTRRPLCPYPLVAAYQGGNSNEASSFKCRPSFKVEDTAGFCLN